MIVLDPALKQVLIYAFALVFIGCVVWAAVSDVKGLRIPNWITMVLIASFLAFATVVRPELSLAWHFALAGGVFLLGFALYAAGVFGGGDAKLLTALTLWAGPEHGAAFGVYVCIFGGILAAAILVLQRALLARPGLESAIPAPQIASWAKNGVCPYGLPLALAALMIAPAIF